VERYGSRVEALGRILAPVRESAGREDPSFGDFVRFLGTARNEEMDGHWRPQYTYLCTRRLLPRRLTVDFVGKVESIAEDWRTVCERTGLEMEMGHANRSDHAESLSLYDRETWNIVARRYRIDFQVFGYQELLRSPFAS
jgi:hypothetical protein